MKMNKTIALVAALSILIALLTGCGASSSGGAASASPSASSATASSASPVSSASALSPSAASSPTGTSAQPAKATYTGTVRTVVVGTGNDMDHFCFLDEKGNLVGLEVDLLNAVNAFLPQYKFEFQTSDFAGILVGLDAGKYNIAAHYYAKNKDRAAKYLYADVPYLHYAYKIAVAKGRTDIKAISDLEGKIVLVGTGSNAANFLELYNKTAKTPIDLQYGTIDAATMTQSLANGRIDATISTTNTINDWNKNFGNKVDGVGDDLLPGYTYYIFKKGDDQLQKDVDAALTQLRSNGTISQLSLKWLGEDDSALVPALENAK